MSRKGKTAKETTGIGFATVTFWVIKLFNRRLSGKMLFERLLLQRNQKMIPSLTNNCTA